MVSYPSQKAPSAKRCIKTSKHMLIKHIHHQVRKHRAPNGALRREPSDVGVEADVRGQKAPSAKRCIKTRSLSRSRGARLTVRKHRAPKGALRHHIKCNQRIRTFDVRKHRAPKGALRPVQEPRQPLCRSFGQKAPSAKRCIKTTSRASSSDVRETLVRKHRAPKGALRLSISPDAPGGRSTGQKAPSAIRCIKT